MALSMAVLLVPVLIFVLLYRFLGHETPPTVDTASVYDAARVAHPYDVLTPSGLPGNWHITTANYANGELRLTVDTPSEGGALFVETTADPATLVPAEVGQSAHLDKMIDINGVQWQHFIGGRSGEQALVQVGTNRTILIVGKASDAEQKELAASLH
jgi:hypothetical protein